MISKSGQCGILWYLHIGKCGGTEALEWKRRMPFDDILYLMKTEEGAPSLNYTDWEMRFLEPILNNPKGKLVAIHHHHRGPGLYRFDEKFKHMQERLAVAGCKLTRAVILRDPIDKELSLLKYNHGWSVPVFEDVLSRVSDDVELENGQVRYILNNLADSKYPVPTGLAADDVLWQRALYEAVRILEQFEFVGFAEHLPAELGRLAAILGFTTSAPFGNANQNSAWGVLNDLPARLQQRISELVQVDIKLYQKARELN